ncbi:MAG: hypothetical protein ACTHL8_03840 [Burkholderiaceae bacterium]
MRHRRGIRLAALALLASAHALAGDAAAVCRGFCDADSKACRRDAQDAKDWATSPLFTDPHADALRREHDDFSDAKERAAERAAENDRFAASRQCASARMACMQRCATPPAAAASAP